MKRMSDEPTTAPSRFHPGSRYRRLRQVLFACALAQAVLLGASVSVALLAATTALLLWRHLMSARPSTV